MLHLEGALEELHIESLQEKGCFKEELMIRDYESVVFTIIERDGRKRRVERVNYSMLRRSEAFLPP